MKKRAGLARALVLDPEIILVDEPDSGLDPVRTAYLNQLLVDLNTQLDATIMVVTHHLGTARSMPDNIGMLFRKNLVMFGPREVLLTSEEPVVQQFLQGRRIGPIGMSEEKDSAQMEAEMEELKKQGGSAESEESFIDPQINPTEGIGERKAVERRKDRVMQILHTLPEKAQTAILESLTEEDMQRYGISKDQDRTELIEITRENPPEDADPFGYEAMQENQSESMVEGSPAGEGDGEGEQAGSGDPNADAEARRAPPDPPESDEPLVGVPVDEYAGGTVVLPQAGEHTKSDEEKSDASGAGQDSDSDSEDDQDSDGQNTGGQNGGGQDSDDRSSDEQDTQVHQQSSERSDQDRSEQQETRAHQQPDQDQGPSRDQGVRLEEQGPPSRPRHAAEDDADQHTEEIPLPTRRDADGQQNGADDGKPSPQKREGGLRRLFHRS